jgi:hypothetical protein
MRGFYQNTNRLNRSFICQSTAPPSYYLPQPICLNRSTDRSDDRSRDSSQY